MITKQMVDTYVGYMADKKIEPCLGGFFVLDTGANEELNDDIIEYALLKKLLINPTRQMQIKYIPRQVYRCDHMFDKIEDNYIVVDCNTVFWNEHETKYQEWLKKQNT